MNSMKIIAKLPSICIHNIIKHLNIIDQRTCILINRHWYMESIDKLWYNPLTYVRKLHDKNRTISLIDVYMKCITKPTKVTCDYASFLRILCLDFFKQKIPH